jgi:leucyl/phenylalanyl-tRNA--protein transferase
MSARKVDVLDVVSRYASGFFPLYDPWGRFYWERLPLRAVLPMTAEVLARAQRMARRPWKTLLREGPCEFRYTTAVPEVILHLRDERVKENSWVREDVVHIYDLLHAAGLLQTIELWQTRGGKETLTGGLLGLVLPGTFIAETMFGLVPEASKLCVCRLVEDCWNAGAVKGEGGAEGESPAPLFRMIDVQTPHDPAAYGILLDLAEEFGPHDPDRTAHPCVRLGEETLMLRPFMQAFTRAWRDAFAGGVEDWLATAVALQRAARGDPRLLRASRLPRESVRNAYAMLRHTLPATFRFETGMS